MSRRSEAASSIAYRQWEALGGQLVIDFTIDRNPADRQLSTALVRSGANPKEHETIEITTERWTHVNLAFKNGVCLAGRFTQRDNVEIEGENSISIFVDIHFGFLGREQMHFEGVIVYCPAAGPPGPPFPPVPPSPPPIPPDDGGSGYSPGPVPQVFGPPQDLFPYVYVRDWSAIELAEHGDAFIRYVPAELPDRFIAALEEAQDRPARVAVAEGFVEGKEPHRSRFLAEPRGLASVLGRFPRIAQRLHGSEEAPEDWLLTAEFALVEALEQSGQSASYLRSAEYRKQIERAWASYFALVVLNGLLPRDRDDLARLLWTAHLVATAFRIKHDELRLRDLDDARIRDLRHAVLLLPEWMRPRSERIVSGKNSAELYAIGDLQMVRHQLLGYVPGEIARIDNVMPGERREVRNEHLEELYDEQASSSEELRTIRSDAGDERVNLLHQAQRLVGEKLRIKDYGDLTTTYGPPTNATMNGKLTVTTRHGQPSRVEDATSFARNILSRSVEEIGHSVRRLRMRAALSRTQETISSVIDNSASECARVSTFRWVDQLYEAHVVEYGHRLMLEFSIDHPARNFIARHDEDSGHRLRKPLSPAAAFDVKSFEDITPANYAAVCAAYKVTDIRPPPAQVVMIGTTLRGDDEQQLVVPAGYQTVKAKAESTSVPPGEPTPAVRVGSVELAGGKEVDLPAYGEAMPVPVSMAGPVPGLAALPEGPEPQPLPPPPPPAPQAPPKASGFEPSLPGMRLPRGESGPSDGPRIEALLTNVEIRCEPTPRAMSEWRIAIYRAVIEGWDAQVREYYRGIEQSSARHGAALNPRYERDAERAELISACIALMIGDPVAQAAADDPDDGVGLPQLLQFLELAIEWGEMAYELAGDLAGKGRGPDLAKDEAPFANFLQASRARILVPVSPVRLRALLYFWSTGQVWDGPDWLVPVHRDQAALAFDAHERVAQSREVHRGCWRVLVPTAMQILDDCCDKLGAVLSVDAPEGQS